MIILTEPNPSNTLLDARIAFNPRHFKTCPSLPEVELAFKDKSRLDFDMKPHEIPATWSLLREETRPLFSKMNIWRVDPKFISNQPDTK